MIFRVGDKVKIVNTSIHYGQSMEVGVVTHSYHDSPKDFGCEYVKGHRLDEDYPYFVEFLDGYENCYRDEDLTHCWHLETRVGSLL